MVKPWRRAGRSPRAAPRAFRRYTAWMDTVLCLGSALELYPCRPHRRRAPRALRTPFARRDPLRLRYARIGRLRGGAPIVRRNRAAASAARRVRLPGTAQRWNGTRRRTHGAAARPGVRLHRTLDDRHPHAPSRLRGTSASLPRARRTGTAPQLTRAYGAVRGVETRRRLPRVVGERAVRSLLRASDLERAASARPSADDAGTPGRLSGVRRRTRGVRRQEGTQGGGPRRGTRRIPARDRRLSRHDAPPRHGRARHPEACAQPPCSTSTGASARFTDGTASR